MREHTFKFYVLLNYSMDNTFYYITVATKPHPLLDILIKTVESKDEKIEVLGGSMNVEIGKDVPNGIGRSFVVKLHEVSNFLKREYLHENDIVLFSDAYDVYYCGDKSTVIERFEKINKPIVFGAEQNCYPDGTKNELYPFTSSRFKYLNSGLFIGRVGALRECMKNYDINDKICDDQLWWTNKFLERQDLIALDYTNELFLNCLWIDNRELIINDDKLTFNNTNPQLIHGNGPSKALLTPLVNYATNKYALAKISL